MRIKAEVRLTIDITDLVNDGNLNFPQAEEKVLEEIESSYLDCLGDIIYTKIEIK